MVQSSSLSQQLIQAKAFNLSERLNLRDLSELKPLTTVPFTLAGEKGGYIVLFRYGAVVFFDIPPMEEEAMLSRLKKYLIQPYDSPNSDQVEIRIGVQETEGIQQGAIYLNQVSLEALQVIAEILAKSLVLEYYEASVAQSMDAALGIIRNVKKQGFTALHSRELLSQLSGSLLSLHEMAGFVAVSEKPDLLWEHPEFEKLYAKLEDEYEIRERHMALDKKVELIFRAADTLMDMLHTKRSLRVEWYIVVLILIEIFLIVFDILMRSR